MCLLHILRPTYRFQHLDFLPLMAIPLILFLLLFCLFLQVYRRRVIRLLRLTA